MTSRRNALLRIMLSGFESDSEKTYVANIIEGLGGTYLYNGENPQAYLPSCTHIICKKPSRSEKYLAACAAGKWVLTCYFIHDSGSKGTWANEKNYEWGANLSPLYPTELQMAPKRWRERITVKKHDPPFLGWKVGLVMKESFVQPYKRILEAGGGEALDVTSWYSAEASKSSKKDHVQALLTHVFVTPKFVSRISRSRAEDIPYLRADYLATYLLNEQPPDVEEYSIFKKTDPESVKDKQAKPKSPPSTTLPKAKKEQPDPSTSTPVTQKIEVETDTGSSQESEPVSTAPSRLTFAHPTRKKKESANKPLPASVFAKSSFVFVTPNKTGPAAKSASSDQQKPQTTQKSLFDIFESARAIKFPGSRSSGKEPGVQLRDVRVNVTKVDTAQRPKTSAQDHVPTISLGAKRSERDATSSKRQAATDASGKSTKCHFTDEFFLKNEEFMKEFAARKKRQETSYGILEELINEDFEFDDDLYLRQGAKPFSRELMTSLEASLEVDYRYSYFLKEVASRMTRVVFPPHDVLFVIMKVILLDTEDKYLANAAYRVLIKISELHPPQAPDIKSEKLYHKAFALMNAPDADETSSLMTAVGDLVSQSNGQDWRHWCSRDTTLGTHWTFFSRVLNLAIKPATPLYDEMGIKREAASKERVQNATLLTKFLANLVVKDYRDVLVRNDYPTHSPMIKCLIADLLWPTMTGLEPWFRRPSPNLADMVVLFVRSVEACVSSLNAEEADNSSIESNDGDAGDIYDPVENSRTVLEQMSRFITVTSSWCVHCDVRDRERGKRTSKRSLESELVSALRSELEEKNMDVLEMSLQYLPPRLRIKVNLALIQNTCSDVLVSDSVTPDENLSLEIITSRHMQMIPTVLQGEERSEATGEQGTSGPDANDGKSEPVMSSTKVNKRNPKGETPLHIACMNNRPEVVAELLKQPGIDPNATDYAGWTALGEACNHGHIDCVRALLTLPVKKNISKPSSDSDPLTLELDISLCPAEGQTPLHDALGNDHFEIACLLLQKGGVELLDKVDSDGRTPLDYCLSESSRSRMIEYACKIAAKSRRQKMKTLDKSSGGSLMTLASPEEYEKALPRKSVLDSDDWRERVRRLCNVTWLLLSNYVTSGDIINACMRVELEDATSNPSSPEQKSARGAEAMEVDGVAEIPIRKESASASVPSGVSKADLLRYANDITYCLRWRECWETYTTHICRLLGGEEEAIADVVADTLSPIPTDLIPDIPDK